VAELGGFAGALAAFEGDETGLAGRGHGIGLAKRGGFVTRAGWREDIGDGKPEARRGVVYGRQR
jgi:hypothetical protein